jgi:hypothetical protein
MGASFARSISHQAFISADFVDLEIGPERRGLCFASRNVSSLYRVLAMTTDVVHAAAMVAWGLGLPLLVWHRRRRLSRAYAWFAMAFVISTVASQQVLGECFFTRLARELWNASGGFREDVPFTVVFANAVAGIRPTTRTAVLLWETAVFVTSAGSLWCWHRTHPRRLKRAHKFINVDLRPGRSG